MDAPPCRRLRAALAALLLLAAGGGACREGDAPDADADADAAPALTVDVRVAEVGRGAITQRIAAPGSLVALRSSPIGPEVRGVLQEVLVDEGDRVEAGELLFRIDPEPYEVALRRAQAGLDLARAERLQTASDLARARSLLARDVVSQQEVDRLETTLAVARARERQAAEAVEIARLDLRRTRVEAPYAGTVAQRLADEGTSAQAQPQTIVLVLQEIHELEGRATIPEVHLSSVSVGDRARVFVEGFPEPFETTISAVGDVVDPATRTYEVRMRVPNPERRLKAGVFAQVEILPAPRRDVLLVPRDALRTEEGRTRVLAVRDGRAVAVPVELGLVSEDAAEVLQGLEDGERVIVGEAAQTLAPGMAVRVEAGAGDAS